MTKQQLIKHKKRLEMELSSLKLKSFGDNSQKAKLAILSSKMNQDIQTVDLLIKSSN
jgi:hypothetical protein